MPGGRQPPQPPQPNQRAAANAVAPLQAYSDCHIGGLHSRCSRRASVAMPSVSAACSKEGGGYEFGHLQKDLLWHAWRGSRRVWKKGLVW